MKFNPLEWLRVEAASPNREPLKKIAAGFVVWLLAGFVVWWNQDARATLIEKLGKVSPLSLISWIGTLVGMGLFWGGSILVLRPLTSRGFLQSALVRCQTVERLALVFAAGLTLFLIVLHWFFSVIDPWMLAAVAGLWVLASAFGWKLPWTISPPKRPPQ